VLSALIHELSAPITVIEGFVELIDLPRDQVDDETFRRAVEAIRRNAAYLRGLMTAFADARRIDVDALDLRRQPTDVAVLVSEAAESLRALVEPHPLLVDAPDGAVADVDPVRVRQAVINLVQNAAKFSDPEGPVEISVTSTGHVVCITVVDHGHGIAPDDREEVFGKFTRLYRDAPGTGLGLYISRGIARAHGGDIVLEESGPTGSRFSLTLPIGSPA
jgi:signal transduction histidine kinase